ncbi:MAG: 30S ribosomal protein S21 [Bizionia sp.]|nr:30S ribosomal protein S21 [Bizionia sp.]
MLRIPVKDGENIERALKVYKRKFMRTQTKNRLQENKQFTKPSVAKRALLQKAQYVQKLKDVANA